MPQLIADRLHRHGVTRRFLSSRDSMKSLISHMTTSSAGTTDERHVKAVQYLWERMVRRQASIHMDLIILVGIARVEDFLTCK